MSGTMSNVNGVSASGSDEAKEINIDNEEIDLEHVMEVLDTALTSRNPIVQDQVRKLLLIAALTSSPNPQRAVVGPFSRMRDDIRKLQQEFRQLRVKIKDDGSKDDLTKKMFEQIKMNPEFEKLKKWKSVDIPDFPDFPPFEDILKKFEKSNEQIDPMAKSSFMKIKKFFK